MGRGIEGVELLRARGLSRRFGRKDAVKDLDLVVHRGEVVALVGPNGAGKTTALRMMLGLLWPSAGEVRIVGLDPIRDRLDVRLRTSYVPDEPRLQPWMRAGQLLEFCRELHPRWSERRASELIERFGLALDRRVGVLSRGEAAQLSFTIAEASLPELLILDEPSSGLDPLVRRAFLSEIRRIVEGGQRSVLFSTHVMADVDGVADRVVVMSGASKLVDCGLDELRGRFTRISLFFDAPPPADLVVPGARTVTRGLREVVALFDAATAPDAADLAARLGARDARVLMPTFEEVFIELLSSPANATRA